MAFTRTWNTSYESSPANTDDISNDAQVARQLKVDIRERLEIDHSWAGDANDGQHKKATLVKQTSDPGAVTDRLVLFTKTNSDKLYAVEPGGTTLQITPPVGSIFDWALSTEPEGYIFADGRTLGETGAGADHEGERFRELFDLIKVEGFGNAGTEDFDTGGLVSLPDLRDRVAIGAGTMGNSDAGRISNETTALGDTGGEDVHTLTVSEMPSHNHGGSTGGNTSNLQVNTVFGGGGTDRTNVDNPVTNRILGNSSSTDQWENLFSLESGFLRDVNHSHSISSQGGGSSHNNLQPFIVLNKIIKY